MFNQEALKPNLGSKIIIPREPPKLALGGQCQDHPRQIAKFLPFIPTFCLTLRMRITLRLLANPTAAGSTSGLRPAPLALLPPLPLYRRLLRSHRKYLPKEMRVLGDEYIKSEFQAHRNVDNPMHIVRPVTPLEFSQTDPVRLDRLPHRMADVRPKNRR